MPDEHCDVNTRHFALISFLWQQYSICMMEMEDAMLSETKLVYFADLWYDVYRFPKGDTDNGKDKICDRADR